MMEKHCICSENINIASRKQVVAYLDQWHLVTVIILLNIQEFLFCLL